MELSYPFSFSVELECGSEDALAFVRDVAASLRYAEVLSDLQVLAGDPKVMSASLPVSAALFGQHELPFKSALRATPDGATLEPLSVVARGPGSAEVAGTARVSESAGGSQVDYSFVITVRLRLPDGGKWGEKALLKLVNLTAQSVLRSVASRLEPAVARAAAEYEPVVTSRRRSARRSQPASPR